MLLSGAGKVGGCSSRCSGSGVVDVVVAVENRSHPLGVVVVVVAAAAVVVVVVEGPKWFH